jgi:hypothetical protein
VEQESILAELDFNSQLTDIKNELELKKQSNGFNLSDNQLAHDQKIENLTTEQTIKIRRMNLDAELEEKLKIAEAQAKLSDTKFSSDDDIRRRSAHTDNALRKESALTDAEIRKSSGMTDIELQKAKQDVEWEAKERKMNADLNRLERLVAIKNMKYDAKQQRNIDLLKAADGADMAALLMATEDPVLRKQLLDLHLQQQKQDMSPEKILAVAAAQGNKDAADALIALISKKQKED